MSKTASDDLGTLLVKAGIITPDQLAEAVSAKRDIEDTLDQVLIDRKSVSRSTLLSLLMDHYKIPFVALPDKIAGDTLKLIPEHVVSAYQAVPLSFEEGILTVAMSAPDNIQAVERLSAITGYKIKVVGVLDSDLRHFLSKHYEDTTMTQILKEISVNQNELIEAAGAHATEDDATRPMTKLVDSIISLAAKKRASDIHIEPQNHFALLRFRMDGVLQTQQSIPKTTVPSLVARIKVMADLNIAEKRLPQDGQFRHKLSDREVDIRVSIVPSRYGEKVAMRVLDRGNFLMTLDTLGMPADMQSEIGQLISRPNGLVLVTGPTGSGKTTSLYALVQKVRSPRLNIMTLEDPIEYELLAGSKREGGITQIQINPKLGLDFASGLRACLRQDPDIIVVGEIRDRETAETSISATLTGHMVFASLHTNGAIQTIVRLMDMGVEPFLIVSSVRAIIAQRLVRVLCHHCKQPYRPLIEVLKKLNLTVEEGKSFYRPIGCEACQGQGYWGRTGVFEAVRLSNELNSLILQKKSQSEIFFKAREGGLKTLKEHGMELVGQGITTVEEVLRVLPAL